MKEKDKPNTFIQRSHLLTSIKCVNLLALGLLVGMSDGPQSIQLGLQLQSSLHHLCFAIAQYACVFHAYSYLFNFVPWLDYLSTVQVVQTLLDLEVTVQSQLRRLALLLVFLAGVGTGKLKQHLAWYHCHKYRVSKK